VRCCCVARGGAEAAPRQPQFGVNTANPVHKEADLAGLWQIDHSTFSTAAPQVVKARITAERIVFFETDASLEFDALVPSNESEHYVSLFFHYVGSRRIAQRRVCGAPQGRWLSHGAGTGSEPG
jgi:hypothetical protein